MRIGKITENVLKRSVWKQIHNGKYKNGAAGYTDCACFETDDINEDFDIVSSVHTVTVNSSYSGKYAVITACNNLIAGGGEPLQILISITLPADAQEAVIRKIMNDAQDAAAYYKAEIAGGHTEVSGLVKAPLVTATAIGYRTKEGIISESKSESDLESDPESFDIYSLNKSFSDKKALLSKSDREYDIVVTKWIALSGTAMLAEEKGDIIRKRYPSFIIDAGLSFGKMDYLSVYDEARIAALNKAVCIHDISSGGIFAALWELGQMTGLGMEVDLKAIPIRQETVEITDVFDLNPYLLASGGSLLIAAFDGGKMVKALEEEGIPAAVIGKLVKGNDRIIRNEDETRFLDLPQSDEILKVLVC